MKLLSVALILAGRWLATLRPGVRMTDAEKAWEEAKKDIERHDAEFEKKYGKGKK